MADTPRLEFIFAADVSLGPPLDCGDVGKGRRCIVPITGATFFETDDARHGWITKCIVVCSGEREPAGVKLKFYKVL